jgi:RNA polymerase sigma-70 factor (ECF subfamily)
VSDTSLALVRQFLLDRYDDLKYRLTLRLGSSDLAGDALQDAWLNIHRANTLGVIRNPGNYIFGVAMNAARDRMRDANNRILSAAEVEGLLEIVDEAPSPADMVEAQSDWRVLEAILQELPARRREILLMARRNCTTAWHFPAPCREGASTCAGILHRPTTPPAIEMNVRFWPMKNVLSLSGGDLIKDVPDRMLPDWNMQPR